MRRAAGINKWGSAVLGLVCAFLVANLVTQYRGMQPGHAQAYPGIASATHTRAGKSASHLAEDLAKYDPEVHFDALKELDSRPLPDEDRNPFEFVGGPVAPPPASVPLPRPLPPPPPPPPPLKAVGYNELPGGQKEAMVTLNQDLNVVHEGDMIGTKYKVESITAAQVVVEDVSTHEKINLPIPQ
jgi:hypothetical protein